MKISCSKCKKDLPEERFSFRNKAKGLRRRECKECFSVLSKKHYKENKNKYYTNVKIRRERNCEYIKELLQRSKCTDCENTDWRVLEFDHISNKNRDISEMKTNCGLDSLISEIDKCEIVCANCHRIRSYSRQENCYRNT